MVISFLHFIKTAVAPSNASGLGGVRGVDATRTRLRIGTPWFYFV